MKTGNDDEHNLSVAMYDAAEADKFAKQMDDVLLDIADLDAELCPPDYRYIKSDREAWVYEHGNVAELVFVKTN
ncbi:MAG: hypothetical protein AAF217_00240 [Pseudomonadota bacterium]